MDLDSVLQILKRLEQRFYDSQYRALEAQRAWMQLPQHTPVTERVFDLAPPMERVHSILIFKPDEIGDAIHSLPAIQKLKDHFPSARLFLLCQNKTRPIFERTKLFDEIVSVDVKMRLLRFPFFSLHSALKKFSVQNFDVALFLRTYPAYFRYFKKISAQVCVHPQDPRMPSKSIYQAPVSLWGKNRVHQSVQMLQILAPITGKRYSIGDVKFPKFHWEDKDRKEVESAIGHVSKPILVIHPFARYETRRYPYWKALLVEISKNGKFLPVVVGGKEDEKLDLGKGLELQGQLSLGATGYLLSTASAFLGNEAGPAHWAAAIGIPTVMIMSGHSAPREWAPLGNAMVLRADVPCAPCHRRTCPVYKVQCLTALKPDRVILEIDEFLLSRLKKRPLAPPSELSV